MMGTLRRSVCAQPQQRIVYPFGMGEWLFDQAYMAVLVASSSIVHPFGVNEQLFFVHTASVPDGTNPAQT